MSKEIVKQIVQRTKKDSNFLQALLQNPDMALKEYPLTDKEKAFFRGVDEKTLEGLSERCFELSDGKKNRVSKKTGE